MEGQEDDTSLADKSLIAECQVVASCDSATGVTIVHEDSTRLTLDDAALVEVSIINISGEALQREIEDLDTVSYGDDEESRESFENAGVEEEEDEEDEDSDLYSEGDEEFAGNSIQVQPNMAEDYFAGKITFHDFIAAVNGTEPEQDDDVSDDEDVIGSESDSDYEPEETRKHDYQKELFDSNLSKLQSSTSAPTKQISTTFKASSSPTKSKSTAKKTGFRCSKKLPQNLKIMMGEANLRWVRNERKDAIEICKHVMKQAPECPEPFVAMSMFYESMGDSEMSYQLSLIAAHLSPQNAEAWIALSEACLFRNDLVEAAKCFSKAVQADPSNLEIHERRCDLLESMGAEKELLQARLTMLRCVQPENDEEMGKWVDLAVVVARNQHADGHLNSARKALSNALVHCSGHFSMEQYNILLELQILTKKYFDVVKVLNRHCGLVFDNQIIDLLDLKDSKEMKFNQVLPLDILAKLCIALIRCERNDFALPMISTFLAANVEDFGDIYLDVAEVLMESGLNEPAIPLLEMLVASESHSLPAVWLIYANCLTALNQYEEAIKAFRHVINSAPTGKEARLALAELLTKLGRDEEALEAVTQDAKASIIEASVLHRRCLLLLKEERFDQFIHSYKLLMMRHAKNIKTKDEIHKACGAKKVGWDSDDEDGDDEGEPEFGSSAIELDEEYRLLRVAAEYLFNQGRLVELERICFTALTSPLFRRKREILKEIQFITLQVCMKKGDSFFAYNLARGLLLRNDNLNNLRVWNLLIQVIMRGDDIRYNRFLMRLLVKHPEHLILTVVNGHACVASGTYKYALDVYMHACKLEPDNPFYLLLASIVLVQLTCQKFSSGKHSLVSQVTSFFDAYMKTRGDCQEVYYNIGRGMHQLGLLIQALHFYLKALNCPPSVTKGKHAHIFDLSKEIAFNMSLIYRNSDLTGLDLDQARMYLDKYITI